MDKSDVVVVAAGVGSRMGAKVPKQYLKLGNSCILERTVNALLVSEAVRRVIVVIAKDDPYNHAGLITSFEVEPWMVAVGLPAIVKPQ